MTGNGVTGKVYIGTSGWAHAQWRNGFYPPKMKDAERLSHYSTRFNALEINTSFYRLPPENYVARWAAAVPDDFVFCFKAWRQITHDKRLQDCASDIARFLESLAPAEKKLGPVLLQLPPGLDIGAITRLETALASFTAAGARVAVECRHASWYQPQLHDILARYNAVLVAHDMRGSACSSLPGANFIYRRFHGAGVKYKGSYPDEILQQTAGQMSDCRNTGKDVFCFFNNTLGDALGNAMTLQKLLA